MAESACRVIQLDEGSEVGLISSDEYIFNQIGASVPLAPEDSQYDTSSLPSQPLAVSEKHRLLFVAHADGFLVARTLDVIQSAKDIKEQGNGPSLREVCVVNVLIGKVHILVLSRDSEMVAACVGGNIHFFLVNSLLNKEQTPHYTCSLNASEFVKDLKWTITNGKSYIVLSNNGNLYHSLVGGSLQHVFDSVDAVEWTVNQSQIALARKNVLSIVSPDFKETLSMSLCFDTWIDGAYDDYTVKVDSIRWVRPDCIILGCLQVTTSGTEENYLVQAVSVKGGRFTDKSSQPIVSSFSELFPCINDDIVTFGTGPHLFLSYLRQCELGIICNKKNIEQHINLIGWSNGDLNSEVAIIDFNREKWAPRIPLQDNGDDNLVVGLCIDRVSLYEKVKFQKGVDDPKELSPYCVIFCLTLEGKLIMFHLASDSDTPTDQGIVSSDEDTFSGTSDVRHDQLKVDSETEQPKLKGSLSRFQSQEVRKNDQLQMEGSEEDPKRNDFTDSKMGTPPTLQGNTVVYTDMKSLGAKTHEPAGHQLQPLSKQNPAAQTYMTFVDAPTSTSPFQPSPKISSGGGSNVSPKIEALPSVPAGYQLQPLSKQNPVAQTYTTFEDSPTSTSLFQPSPKISSGREPNVSSKIEALPSVPAGYQLQPLSKENPVAQTYTTFVDAPTSTSSFQPSPKISSGGGPDVSSKIEALPSVPAGYQLQPLSKQNPVAQTYTTFEDSPTSTSLFQPSPKISSGREPNVSSKIEALPSVPAGHQLQPLSKETPVAQTYTTFVDAPTSTSSFQPSPKISSGGGPDVSPKIEALPSVRNSKLLFQQQIITDNRVQSEMEKYGTRSFTGKLTSEPSLSKGSINIREMTEQLDKLLKDIEETGGFVDSTTGQTNSAVALCHGLEALAVDCDTWKSLMKERHEEIQDLLSKTVQVLARKTYVEGIVKQTSDTHYWDLWDRQRLGYELDMKRGNIIKIHQELTNQLIQLEMHFNNLELNKFGQRDGADVSHGGLQSRLREPRHLQSINSLQNTVRSQLVVAEQLSQCLSEQMALLNVDSPCPKQQNVKRDLFKTIGLPLDAASFNSPGNSSLKRLSVLSSSSSSKDQAQRNQTTGYKNLEPETARRRRESLDRSWVAFEPHKTTVKRTVPREGRKSDIEKPLSIPRMLEESLVSQKERRTPSNFYPSRNKVVQDTLTVEDSKSSVSRFKWVDNDTKLFQTEGTVSYAKANLMPFSSPSISSKPLLGQSGAKAPGCPISERAVVRGSSSSDLHDTKSAALADSKDGRTNLGMPFTIPSMMPQSHVTETSVDRPTTQGIFTLSSKGMGAQFSQVSIAPEVPKLSGKALQLDGGSSQSHSGSEVISFPASSSTTLFSSVSSVSAAPSVLPLPLSSITKSSPFADAYLSKPFQNPKSISEATKLTFPVSTSQSSFLSSSSTHFSEKTQIPVMPNGTSPQLEELSPFAATSLMKPKIEVTAESATSVPVQHTSSFTFTPKLEDSLPQAAMTKISEEGKPQFNIGGASVPLPTSGFSLNLENAAVSEQKVKVQEEGKLNEQSGFGGVVFGEAKSVPNNQPEQPVSAIDGSPFTEKNEASGNAGYQEDEMEEEAPEASPAAEIELGSLGGFGLGSSTPATPNRNPFGGSLGNPSASPASSPFTMSSSGGELFRPASFSFSPTQLQQTTSQPAATSFGGFGSSTTPAGFGFAANQAPSGGGFGQPAQVGQGQQALGSVLGSFGQSRQIGIGQPANSFAPVSGFGSDFAGSQSAGGFSNAATKSGGFAALASNSGGFAAAASAATGGLATAHSGGFAGVAAPTGGFSGFAGAAGSGGGFNAAGGGGFGQQGSSFSAFGGTGAQPPAQLFTQMRK
ncbi:unnamed protein product [Rhodiola kirilowii]